MSDDKTPGYQDIIMHTPAPIMSFRDSQVFSIAFHPDYYPIVRILQEKPMTVRDLTEEYRRWCKVHGSPKPKSDKTIYRYLKLLGEHGLVVPAGKRVVFGKTATETLYSKAAIFIRYYDFPPDWWDSETSKVFARGVATGMNTLLDGTELDVERFRIALDAFSNKIESLIQEFVDRGTLEDLESVGEIGNTHYIEMALKYIGIVGVMKKYPELIQNLLGCLK